MDISNLRPAFFYNALLNVGVNGAPGTGVPGLSNSLLPVTDGIGVLSPMSISTTAVNFDRSGPNTFQLDTIPLTVSATVLNSLATATLNILPTANQIKLTVIDPNTKQIGLEDDIDGIHSVTTSNIALDNLLVGAGSITTNTAIPLILKPNSNSAVQIGADNSANNLEIRGGSSLILYSTSGVSYSGWKVTSGPSSILEMPILAGTSGQIFMKSTGNATRWADLRVNTVIQNVTQAAHGLVQGNVIKVDPADGLYKKAQANSATNSEAVGIVVDSDTNTFDFVIGGICTPGTVLEPGKTYFLDPLVSGGYTNVDPLTTPIAGQVSKPIFIAIDTVDGVWVNQRGIEIQ